MNFQMSLVDKKILVTGASSGIGRATAICCSELGARVIITGRNKERLEETIDMMIGDGHQYIVKDLGESSEIEALFSEAMSDGIKFDGLVHCAGIPYVMPLKSLTKERLNHVMNINFYSYVELCRQFVKKKYSNDNASIVGISSLLTKNPRAFELGYIASKSALEAATRVLAIECANRNIRANCISPGSVQTEMIENVMQEQDNIEFIQGVLDKTLFGWIKPEEIANTISFLLSDLSNKITGEVINVHAGYF